MTPYRTSERFHSDAFFCCGCNARCQHTTAELKTSGEYFADFARIGNKSMVVVVCSNCGYKSYDLYEPITDKETNSTKHNFYRLYPVAIPSNIPQPNSYLPEKVVSLYKEAALIFAHSPRSSATLLRLALQHLLECLGFNKGKNDSLNDMIGYAVENGVPEYVQKIMDVTRHIGNQSAHHLTFNPDDTADNAISLFSNINDIALYFIETRERVDKSYAGLPENVRKSIEKRDKKQPSPNTP